MKKKKLVIVSAVLGLLTLAIAAPYYYAQAATTASSTSPGFFAHFMGHKGKNLTAEQSAAFGQKMAAAQSQRAARQEAVSQAIANNDYNAWLTAVGSTSPIAQKINANNFSQYVALYNLEQQVLAQRKALGLDQLGHQGGVGRPVSPTGASQ
jgi:hypothetical protein